MRSWLESRAHPIGMVRRSVLSFAAAALCALLFHSWIAAALILRGDDLIRIGDARRALTYFARAAWFDRAWDVPVERFGFAAMLIGERATYSAEVRIASAYLSGHPRASAIRWDRGVAYLHLGERERAYEDFLRVAAARPWDRHVREVAVLLQRKRSIGR